MTVHCAPGGHDLNVAVEVAHVRRHRPGCRSGWRSRRRKIVRRACLGQGHETASRWPPMPSLGGSARSRSSACANGGIAQVTLASGEVKHEFDEHRGNINRMVVSNDGKVLVSGGWDGAVRFWDLDAGKQLFVGPDHDNAVTAVAVSADGKTVASGCWDNSTIRWGADGKAAARVREHQYLVTAVQVVADGSWWSASQDGTVQHWAADGKSLAKVELEGEGAQAVAMVLAGGQAILAVADGTVRWIDLATGKETKRWKGHGSPVLAVVADEAGAFVASLEEGGTAIVWNVATGEPLHHWVVHEKGAAALLHMGDGVLVATGEGSTLARYDGKAGKELQRVKFEHKQAVTGLSALAALPTRGAVLAAGDGVVFALAAADLKVLGTTEVPSAITSLAASADGSVVVAGLDDGTIAQWKLAAPKPKK